MLISVAGWSQNTEFRATWVVTWEYINSTSSVAENKARIINILEEHKRANMNAVMWQVRQSGTAYYHSSYEPWGPYAGGAYPGFDPLAFVIEEAHKRGMEVHAWFNTFMISSNAEGRITAKHPNWICTNQDGSAMSKYYALSPGIDSVRKYTLNVAMEIVNNYDIDGLHLDYIRWNEYDATDMTSKSAEEFPLDGMISEERLIRLKSSTTASTRFIFDKYHPYSGGVPAGYSTWEDWRRAGVTEMVKMVHDSIQLIKPHVRLSTAVLGKYKTGGDSGWNGYYIVFQDGALWFNQGYVDQLTPMHYHWTTGTAFLSAIESDWEPSIQPGIIAKRLYSAGPASYILDENDRWNNHADIVTKCRTKSWIDGFQFFSYASWHSRDYWDEAGNTFFKRMTRIRPALLKTPPPSPLMAISKKDSMNYEFTVTPSTSDNCWYVIYRSEDETLDTDSDKIIYTTFGKAPFTASDNFDGLQSFNGKYSYFASAFNRYWNESLPSNSVKTDSIPSFAPVVISTIPTDNGLLAVNRPIYFEFSKEMDTISFSPALDIQPIVNFSVKWSSDKKTACVNFASLLSYDTPYTVVLSHDLKDSNGKELDGNGDGQSGDNFTFHFRTLKRDSEGPVLIQSTVSNNENGVDVASVFSFTFNEIVLSGSLASSGILLKNNTGSDVAFRYTLYETADSKSVITVQPTDTLHHSSKYTLTIAGSVSDTIGNTAGGDMSFTFNTSAYYYTSSKLIDEFNEISGWQSPSYSGSTVGLVNAESSFGINTLYGLPASLTASSARLIYSWDPSATIYLIREYLTPSSAPALIEFDTTWSLQTYIFGDSSNVKIRFCIDENSGTAWTDHEVSQWETIDWRGWKLVEWKLSDANSIGSWISSDNKLLGTSYRTDSYQFTRDNQSAYTGTIYFDNYRVVKKVRRTTDIKDIKDQGTGIIKCYPNPFAQRTMLSLTINKDDRYTLTVYNISGQVTEKLRQEYFSAGTYYVSFGENYKPGVYLIELRSETERQSIRCIKK
jgi:uncharacterized lipoprotein YddW (UPF0748 family)